MLELIKEDVLKVIHTSVECIEHEDILALREQSNHTLHNASIYQDKYAITIAVVIYALSKIFERPDYRKTQSWEVFNQSVRKNLQQAEKELHEGNISAYELSIENVLNNIDRLDPKLKHYTQQVLYLAKVNKASRFYEHGLSLGRTAELLGISQWELMDYTGKTGISDVKEARTLKTNKRIELTKQLFEL
jgi:hypothetical protein